MHFQAVFLLGAAIGVSADVYNLQTTIPWTPKQASSVDQSQIYNSTYYLSDRTNGGVQVVSLTNNTQITIVKGFTTGLVNGSVSPPISGPAGIAILPNRNELFAGDGDGTIKVIDLFTNKIVANISMGSKTRADEIAYDPSTSTAVVTIANDNPPFVAVVDAAARKVIGTVTFNGSSGLEQPRYDPTTKKFYVSVPDSPTSDSGYIAMLNVTPGNVSVAKQIATPQKDNAGIVFGPQNQVFVGYAATEIADFGTAVSYILDITTGAVLHNVSGVAGADQVAYSTTSGYYFASCYQYTEKGVAMPFLGVIATNGTVVQKIVTDNVTAHSVAVDEKTGNMVVPVKAKGILVYSLASSNTSGGASGTSSGSTPATVTTSGASVRGFSAVVAMAGALVAFAMML
jgi:hypothetical protein